MPTIGVRHLLLAVCAIPVVYFGGQVAAVPFYPNYSLLVNTASDLGSDKSLRPEILNSAAMVTGALGILGFFGLGLRLPAIGTPKALAWLLAACVASVGLSAIWAALHPLPRADHDPGIIGLGMLAAPIVSALVAWRTPALQHLKWPLTFNVAAFAACAAVLSGAAGINLAEFGGLAQKVAVAVSSFPLAIIAYAAFRALQAAARDT
ncbi:MAG: DUF998 domain-containing protein [Pirellulales bacterium]